MQFGPLSQPPAVLRRFAVEVVRDAVRDEVGGRASPWLCSAALSSRGDESGCQSSWPCSIMAVKNAPTVDLLPVRFACDGGASATAEVVDSWRGEERGQGMGRGGVG